MSTYFIFFINFLLLLSTLEAFSNEGNNTIAAICNKPSEDGLPDFVPHPYDCNLFFECPDGALMSCGDGLVFNPISNICDWPGNVNCTNKPNPNPGDCCEIGDEVRCYLKHVLDNMGLHNMSLEKKLDIILKYFSFQGKCELQ